MSTDAFWFKGRRNAEKVRWDFNNNCSPCNHARVTIVNQPLCNTVVRGDALLSQGLEMQSIEGLESCLKQIIYSLSLRDYHVDDVWKWELGNWEGRMVGSPAVRICGPLEGPSCASTGARSRGPGPDGTPWRPDFGTLWSSLGPDLT